MSTDRPKWDPASDDDFTRRVAFFRSAGISAKSRGLDARDVMTQELTQSPVRDRKDKEALRAARLLVTRSSGKWVTDRVEQSRHDFDHPPDGTAHCSDCGTRRAPLN